MNSLVGGQTFYILYSISSLLPDSFVTNSYSQYLPSELILTCPSLGAFTKLRKATTGFVCPSICQHGTAWLPLDGFSLNFIHYFLKICIENSSCIKIWQEFWYYTWRPKHVFLLIFHTVLLRMRNVCDESCKKNQNKHFTFNNCFLKITPFMR